MTAAAVTQRLGVLAECVARHEVRYDADSQVAEAAHQTMPPFTHRRKVRCVGVTSLQ